MPYIKQELRNKYDDAVEHLVELLLSTEDENNAKGELNYIICTTIARYIQEKGIRYHRLNDFVGVLNMCFAELYRRIVAPYEDSAIEKNGDIPAFLFFLKERK